MTKTVRFSLPNRYFQRHDTPNGMSREVCLNILTECFDRSRHFWSNALNEHKDGFQILCSADEFALFIVRRYELGNCINGIRDLDPKYFTDPKGDLADRVDDIMNQPGYDLFADRDGYTVDAIIATLDFLNIDRYYPKTEDTLIDVTR